MLQKQLSQCITSPLEYKCTPAFTSGRGVAWLHVSMGRYFIQFNIIVCKVVIFTSSSDGNINVGFRGAMILVLSGDDMMECEQKIGVCRLEDTLLHNYTLDKNTHIKPPDWKKQLIIAELCVVYLYYFFFLAIEDPYILHILVYAFSFV